MKVLITRFWRKIPHSHNDPKACREYRARLKLGHSGNKPMPSKCARMLEDGGKSLGLDLILSEGSMVRRSSRIAQKKVIFEAERKKREETRANEMTQRLNPNNKIGTKANHNQIQSENKNSNGLEVTLNEVTTRRRLESEKPNEPIQNACITKEATRIGVDKKEKKEKIKNKIHLSKMRQNKKVSKARANVSITPEVSNFKPGRKGREISKWIKPVTLDANDSETGKAIAKVKQEEDELDFNGNVKSVDGFLPRSETKTDASLPPMTRADLNADQHESQAPPGSKSLTSGSRSSNRGNHSYNLRQGRERRYTLNTYYNILSSAIKKKPARKQLDNEKCQSDTQNFLSWTDKVQHFRPLIDQYRSETESKDRQNPEFIEHTCNCSKNEKPGAIHEQVNFLNMLGLQLKQSNFDQTIY